MKAMENFSIHKLPTEVQLFIRENAILCTDVNGDGVKRPGAGWQRIRFPATVFAGSMPVMVMCF